MTQDLIRPELIRLQSRAADKDSAIREAGELLVAAGCIEPGYVDSLLRRESLANTFLGHGVAIPHGMAADRHLIHQTGIAVVQIPAGLEWNPGQETRLVFAIAAQSDEHIVLLRRLTRLLQDEVRLTSLFATDHAGELIAALTDGAASAVVDGMSRDDYAERFEWMLDYPNGLHARPATQWVETARQFAAHIQLRHGSETADAKNLISLLQLGLVHGDMLTVSAEGGDATAALAKLQDVMRRLSAQEQTEAALAAQKAQAHAAQQGWVPPGQPLALAGIAASPGLTIGRVHVLSQGEVNVSDHPQTLSEGGDRLDAALAATRAELRTLADDTARRLSKTEAAIFKAHAELLNDTDLLTLTCQLMVEGHGVAWSWHQAVGRLADRLAALGNPLLAARAADLRDVGRRVLGQIEPTLRFTSLNELPSDNCILIATDLSPSDTAALDTSKVIGLATAQGGPTSHTAILARTLGLPAMVAGGAALLDIADGTPAILDGQTGRLYLNPSEADIGAARDWVATQNHRKEREAAERALPAQTRDGHVIEIAANVNRPDQVAAALADGAEGVGLMRTEFLFLERDHAPDEEEQFEVYQGMLEALGGRPLIVRTLDIGGDKQVPHLNLPHEENPFLGVRGARLLLRRPDLLEPQLRALYRAAKSGHPLSIMFPMITSLKEVITLRAICERIRAELDAPSVALGIMVEVPAVAALADRLAEHVDFFSIGTNDLTQYVLAIDRQHPELAAEADSLHPAVLRLIQQTVNGAALHQRWVGVCGGLAGDPFGAALLVGLGVSELSMSPRDVAAVKARLRSSSQSSLVDLAARALDCDSAEAVRALEGELA
ncbi:phosphoenolpyruvate--protein phosphotransferase [Crenobacter sp. SG2303]|uniref:phosphoenolpyruvate--protein phosphotransferase n=1 Tax=Crenobacter oryzisoli TaxID=3056844 RepID=A0ABT7XIN2_9NEIS|nr:phosphoenolpyruvate--protein phosphotransferase [Crenobacter sp. SG2303]MDN0073633.1 phosphoenolpyruvate--protein phosphotransferase [Crenobacter sp. SG2303]